MARKNKAEGSLLTQILTLALGLGISYVIYRILEEKYYIELWLIPSLSPLLVALLINHIGFSSLKKSLFSGIISRLPSKK